jgi:hypothetical protein
MLFKGTSETFNPQMHTEELSLTSQMNKDFAVHNKVISRFERFTKFTSFLFHTGRVDGGTKAGWIKRPSADKEVHDNAYRVKFRALNIKPAFSMNACVVGQFFDETNPKPDMTLVAGVTYSGTATSSNVQTDMIGSFAIKHNPAEGIYGDKFNPQDSVVLNGGLGTLLYIQRIRESITGDHFILDFKVIGQPNDWDEAGLAEDEVLMEGGNYYGEGSMRGYQRYDQSYWKIFYSFISRYTLSFTGNALDQRKVIWANPASASGAMQGHKNESNMWQYEQEWLADQNFAIALELACRFSVSSMDPSTHQWFENSGKNLLTSAHMNPEAGIVAPRTSDGWVRQIKDTIDLSYDVNTGFSPHLLESVGNVLAGNSPAGSTGNQFVVLGDDLAYHNWDTAMKKLLGWNVSNGASISAVHNTNIVQNITGGEKVKLGFEVESYYYKGNEYMFMKDELFSHPGLNNRSGGLVGSGNMYILNVTPFEGVSNFELFSRGQGRFFKKKYVDGMHSLDPARDGSMFASSGFDGGFCHYLAELFPICYVEDTCAVIRGDGRYAGGALAGNAGLSGFPTIR